MSTDLVVFPDVDAILTAALAADLPDTYVSITKPESMTGRKVVIVRRDGGPQIDRVLMATTVALRAYAPDDDTATDLASAVQASIDALQYDSAGYVTAVDVLSGQSPVVDDSLIPCRLFSVQIYVRCL